MRNRIIVSVLLLVAAAAACSRAKTKDQIKPAPISGSTGKDAPTGQCQTVLPAAEQERLLPGRTVSHERSCADGKCFADTCHYNGKGKNVHVLYDCREDTDESMVHSRAYFSTERNRARALSGIGSRAAVDDEGLSFFDDD